MALLLLTPDLETMDAALAGPDRLSAALAGAVVAEAWEEFPGAVQRTRDDLAEDPDRARWGTRLFVLDEPRTLVGWGGFKGPPDGGVVELGYAVAPGFRRRGIAGEAVRAMLAEAFAHPEVEAVIAHTLPEPGPSTRVLERAAFSFDGEGEEGAAWRWRHPRPLT